jgi:hypothetical protein
MHEDARYYGLTKRELIAAIRDYQNCGLLGIAAIYWIVLKIGKATNMNANLPDGAKQTAHIEDWQVMNDLHGEYQFLRGIVEGHPRLPDGIEIRTSILQKIDRLHNDITIELYP